MASRLPVQSGPGVRYSGVCLVHSQLLDRACCRFGINHHRVADVSKHCARHRCVFQNLSNRFSGGGMPLVFGWQPPNPKLFLVPSPQVATFFSMEPNPSANLRNGTNSCLLTWNKFSSILRHRVFFHFSLDQCFCIVFGAYFSSDTVCIVRPLAQCFANPVCG